MGGQKQMSKSILVLCAVMTATLGCDQIKAIGNYFKKSDQTSQAPFPTVAESTPEQNVPETSSAPVIMSENVLARVGRWTITKAEFEKRLDALKEVFQQAGQSFDANDPQNRKDILDELIRQQLLVEDAEQSGLAKQEDVAAAVEEFRRTIIVRESAKKIIDQVGKVSDGEVQKFYDENKDSEQLQEPAEWQIREIVVDTQLRANEISVELLKGTDFAETAKQNSKSESAAKGGDLGFVTADRISPEMVEAVKGLSAGSISSPFKGPNGYYIVKLEGKRGGAPAAFDKVKDNIRQYLEFTKQQEALLGHIDKLRQNIKIEVNEKLL